MRQQNCLGLSAIALVVSQACLASEVAPIDEALKDQLDFRNLDYKVCFGEHSCQINDVTIKGYHRHSSTALWHKAQLYWDPVDGLGILDGGQDDEIDLNERLIVEFGRPRYVSSVWITDLFVDEQKNYSVALNDQTDSAPRLVNDAETAGIEFRYNDSVQSQLRVNGNLSLPNISFNEVIASETFETGGDLRQRLVFEDGTMYLFYTTKEGENQKVVRQLPIGSLDEEKNDLVSDFSTEEEVRDLIAEFSKDLEVDLFEEDERNAKRIISLLDDPNELERLRDRAEQGRLVSDVQNGEVAGILENPVRSTSLMFFSPAGTSNDFSVGGLVVSDFGGN